MDLAVTAHHLAGLLPSAQRFELGSQIRKSATSVPSNVAEGHAHHGDRTYLRHVRIALGSLAELDTQLELVLCLNLIEESSLATAVGEIVRAGQLLHGLERALKRRVDRATLACIGFVSAAASAGALWLLGA